MNLEHNEHTRCPSLSLSLSLFLSLSLSLSLSLPTSRMFPYLSVSRFVFAGASSADLPADDLLVLLFSLSLSLSRSLSLSLSFSLTIPAFDFPRAFEKIAHFVATDHDRSDFGVIAAIDRRDREGRGGEVLLAVGGSAR